MNDFISPIRYMHACVYAIMVFPLITLNKKYKSQKEAYTALKALLYILIGVSIVIPAFIDDFGYSDPNHFVIWIIGSVFLLITYWIVFFFVYKKRLHVCALDMIISVFFCLSGILLGENPPLRCYWALAILAGLLFLLVVVQYHFPSCTHRKKE